MLNLPLKPEQIAGPLLLLLAIVLVPLLIPEAYDSLAYQREDIARLQFWRLVTAHMLHTNLNHLLLNGAGIVLLWAVFGDYYRTANYLTMTLGCALLISAGLYWLVPQLSGYVGLSGVLHGLFVWGALCDIRTRRRSGWLLLFGVIVKVGYESLIGADPQISLLIEARVATEAHLFGVLSGGLLGLFFTLQKRLTPAT
ncbi:rhombosortase [Lacimicrobium sp. SS2-24]|uniref:rhombosortase n=1 Tax=Lacimicrobium sp. SS2-24 TaxID=2005569 RepID=UPI000B4BCE79|nr:rhombosortase [Lacimicrobium sp. SS2-24]